MKKHGVAIIGCGRFAKHFVPLFKAHPAVGKVFLCDIIAEKAEAYSKTFDLPVIESFEKAINSSEIDAVAIFAQRHLHGPLVIEALKHGKHVYSAVPMASEVEECREIVELVEKTGLVYYMGETCYYFPCAMYCREAYSEGKFGKFSYGASQYYHNILDMGYGKTQGEAGMPPLLYPTHSTAMILSAVGSYVKRVACFGCKDNTDNPNFKPENNLWGNEFINQYVFMELANGGTARVTEARGFGWHKPSSYISALYGTDGGYEFSNAQHIFVKKDFAAEGERVELTEVSDYVNPSAMTENRHLDDFKERVANAEWQWNSFSPVQQKEVDRLPKEYKDLPNGHMASHQFLIDDFCKAVSRREQPEVNNAWAAARYTVPGLVAIESSKQGGIPLEVPDFGEYKKN